MRVTTLFCLSLIVVSFITQSGLVLAIDEKFYSSNDILFSNPDSIECASGVVASGGASGSSSLVKSAALQTIFQALLNGGMNSVQVAAVMGNMYQESKFNSAAVEGGNGIGYGLVQWSNSPPNYTTGRRANLEAFAKQKGVPASDVNMQIEFLFKEYTASYKSRLGGTPFENALDVGRATESWMTKFEAPLHAPANDPAALNSVRIPAALKIYSFYKALTPASGVVIASSGNAVGTASCSSANGAVAGSIVDTALGFALESPATNGMFNESDARPTYQVAKKAINPGGSWSDCGMFVATVMIASGVDPDYPKVVTGSQLSYVRSKPTKYEIIEKPTLQLGSISTLQPGDILITSAHTEIYTGKSPYPAVDASLGDRVPSVRPMGGLTWMLTSGAVAARIIK